MTVQDVDFAHKVRGRNISALKSKTTQSKPNVAAMDQVKIPVDLMKLHKEVLLTCDIFVVNKIPYFLTLIRKLYFTAVNNLTNRVVLELFKSFKEVY